MSTETPAEGDLRVYFIPSIPGQIFTHPAKGLAEAVGILDAISAYTLWLEDEAGLMPDMANVGGVSRWESNGDGGFNWYDVDESELEEFEQ